MWIVPEFPSLITSLLPLCLSLAMSSPVFLHSSVMLPMRLQASEQFVEVSFSLRCWAVSSHREQMTPVSPVSQSGCCISFIWLFLNKCKPMFCVYLRLTLELQQCYLLCGIFSSKHAPVTEIDMSPCYRNRNDLKTKEKQFLHCRGKIKPGLDYQQRR